MYKAKRPWIVCAKLTLSCAREHARACACVRVTAVTSPGLCVMLVECKVILVFCFYFQLISIHFYIKRKTISFLFVILLFFLFSPLIGIPHSYYAFDSSSNLLYLYLQLLLKYFLPHGSHNDGGKLLVYYEQ